MSAETLRKAAALMRERAEAATPGPWEIGSGGTWIWGALGACVYAPHHDDGEDCDVPHIASWHPAVALAVADWLEVTARDVGTSSTSYHAALAVARAYLGEVAP